jgi:hypothetical protein
MAFLWAVPVFMKLISINTTIISFVAVAITIYCFKIIIFRPFFVLITLPFLTLISPMLGYFNIIIGNILLSDLFFLLIVLQMIVLFIRKKNLINNFKISKLFFLMSVLFIFSLFFGVVIGAIIGFKPILYFFQLYVIYYYTIKYSTEDVQKQKIINAWLFAIILGCFILIQAFILGQNLQSIIIDENQVVDDKSKLQNLFQATYYYAGFIYLVGIAALLSLIKFILIGGRIKKLLHFLVFLLFFITLILMNNKTVIFSFLFVLVIIQISFISNGFLNKKKLIINTCLFFLIFALVIVPIFLTFIDEKQYKLMIDRFTSSSSLVARIEVYTTSFSKWLTNPVQIFIGMGPDFLDTSGVPEKAINFKKSLVTGIEEGTVDSGWISYLIELGILSFSILVLLFYKALKASYQRFKFQNKLLLISPIGIYVYSCLLFITVTLSTQMLGYTKTSWFPFQLLLFGLMFSTDNKSIKMKNKF